MKSAEGLGHIGSRVMLKQDNVVIFLINTKYLPLGPLYIARISSKLVTEILKQSEPHICTKNKEVIFSTLLQTSNT